MWKAFVSVTLFAVFASTMTYLDIFNNVKTDLGLKHYAEKQHFKTIFPLWMKMPLNTFINLGYIVVGAYWCAITTLSLENNLISEVESYLFYVFNISSAFYGAIQTLRIITQKHVFAVLDQWCTLPFFMLVFIWGLHLKHGWSSYRAAMLITISMASYTLTLVTPIGFEIALGCHILLAVYGGTTSYLQNPNNKSKINFFLAILCLIGFVILKLMDLELPKYHDCFTIISGHFMSKICDIFQIHYVNEYFQSLLIFRWQKSNFMQPNEVNKNEKMKSPKTKITEKQKAE
ncbi:transmembrane protein 187 [Patella vulgata]|uniref:transmembrane protein 187 n=1 Tax=Patella vulgata TaxID=6465 RepID=UPI00217FA34E|nr:transmembrane protein 187 [Patella vulgata]XP_050412089.1 transmembrane protein 187 [Patella vulgata]XP_050412090.1 transmembrane protein 187 [Patella vulgata]XP_050412091.1 transmembrane protein 187 [Patella vulgata]XP_050412093.1 transmembrane protein 187 [Patella vulgata]XP_055958168.1 transmembrane protein 187 [Patella vulgata]